jgi:nitroreductase/NAD-dependent dihydropyrimidine dehydrogenase PreA subunit
MPGLQKGAYSMLFTIDKTRCKRDGLCASVCPAGCIVFEEGGLPEPHEKKYLYCLECGHCMAVCPAEAIRLDRFKAGSTPLDRALRPEPEQIEQFLRGRRSVRAFRDRPVERETVEGLLRTAEYCPSGHNARPTRWSVALGTDKVAEIADAVAEWMREEIEADTPLASALHLPGIVRVWDLGVDMICRNAPALAVAWGPKKGITPREDAVVAVTYLELAANAHGLGACWCGYALIAAANSPVIAKRLGAEGDARVYGALMLGHPAVRNQAIPPRPEPGVTWL